MIGRLGDEVGRSLLLNGHIDVVPADRPDLWTSPPFEPRRSGDLLYGRGAGDMKGGFAMAALALEALLATDPNAIAGSLTFASVLEEECTGNGTLAAARAGVLADAVILPEPSGLDLLLSGVGILWLDVVVTGSSAHAQSADRAVNPVHHAIAIIEALRELEREMNRDIEPAMDGVAHPYNLNVGTFAAGDWPSSVPAIATLRIRVGHPTAWTAQEAEERVRAAIASATEDEPWLREHPPAIRASGFKAQGYALPADDPLAELVAAAHARSTASARRRSPSPAPPMRVCTSTTSTCRPCATGRWRTTSTASTKRSSSARSSTERERSPASSRAGTRRLARDRRRPCPGSRSSSR